MDRGFDQAGSHGHDAQAAGGHLVRETFGESLHRGFGGGVIDVLVGRAQTCCGGGDVDDHAFALRLHPADCGGSDQDGTYDVDVKNLAQARVGQVRHAGGVGDDACVIDQRSQRAGGIDHGKDAVDRCGVSDIGLNGLRARTCGFAVGRDARHTRSIAVVGQDQVIALCGGKGRTGGADAGRCAGDQAQRAGHAAMIRLSISVVSRLRPGVARIRSNSAPISDCRAAS